MNKKLVFLALSLLLVLAFAVPAAAILLTVTIDPIADLQLTQTQLDAGYDVPVTGYVGYFSSPNPKLRTLTVEVEKDASGTWTTVDGFTGEAIPSTNYGDYSGYNFSYTWTVQETGSYVLRVTADFTGGSPDPDATGTEDVTVTLLSEPIVVDFPAAPAIAARILEYNGVDPHYGKGKSSGNYISDVAHCMGPETDFDGISKVTGEGEDRTSNPDYWDAVLEFLNDHPKMETVLAMPTS